MKQLTKILCVALILILASASALAEAKLEKVFQYMPSIKPVQGTNCVIIESKKDNSLGLYTTAGQEIIPFGYASIDYLTNGFFSAYNDKDAVDDKVLWTIDGRKIGAQEYGGFKVFNKHWVAAFVVDPQEQSDKSFQDIKIGKSSYQYSRIDLFYVTDEAASAEPVASLDRDAYAGLLSNMLADALADRLAENRALAESGETVSDTAFEVAFNENDRAELGKKVIDMALERLAAISGVPTVTLAEDTVSVGGGFILRSGDVSCDCSIKTLVAASRASSEADVARVLFQ